MQKYDLAIAIRIGSSQSTVALVQTTFESIMSNIGECKYRFIISTDPDIPKSVKNYVSSLVSSEKTRIEFLGEEKIYWSEFINKAIEASQDCKYFIVAHDDIQVITKNFYRKTLNKIERIEEPTAWISFDDAGYTFGLWSPPTRSGYFSDRIDGWAKRKLFQFHNLPDCWWKLSATERLRNKTVNLFLCRKYIPSIPNKITGEKIATPLSGLNKCTYRPFTKRSQLSNSTCKMPCSLEYVCHDKNLSTT